MHLEGEHALDANAEVHLLQPMEAGQEHGRAREQRQRERHLRGGQRAAEPRQPSCAGRGTRLLAQRLDWRGAGQAKRRGNPEGHGGRRRRHQRKEQDRRR